MKTFKILSLIGIISLAFFSFTTDIQDEWVVPDKYVKMTFSLDVAGAKESAIIHYLCAT